MERDFLYEDEFNNFQEIISINEIIKRCRGLRSITYSEAIKLIYRAYLFFSNYFSQNRELKLIVTGAIDNYVMDLMVRVGECYGIKYLGVTDSLLSPEYKLITVRGELSDFNDKPSDNISNSIKIFEDRILHNIKSCTVPTFNIIFKRNLYNILSFYYRLIVRYFFKYKICGRLEYEYRFSPYLFGFKSVSQLYATKYLQNNFDDEGGKKIAYIPLHFYPEATTDYWMDSIYHVEYLTSVLNTVKLLIKKGYVVYAKEHPHYFLSREYKFYKKLIDNKCKILSPFICTKKVFDKVDVVVVWNGSTGIESMLYGKTTVKVTNSYYGDDIIPNLNEFEGENVSRSTRGCLEKVFQSSFRTR